MACLIIANPTSLVTHKKFLMQALCQFSLSSFPSQCCITQLNPDAYLYFNIIFITVHMLKGLVGVTFLYLEKNTYSKRQFLKSKAIFFY